MRKRFNYINQLFKEAEHDAKFKQTVHNAINTQVEYKVKDFVSKNIFDKMLPVMLVHVAEPIYHALQDNKFE